MLNQGCLQSITNIFFNILLFTCKEKKMSLDYWPNHPAFQLNKTPVSLVVLDLVYCDVFVQFEHKCNELELVRAELEDKRGELVRAETMLRNLEQNMENSPTKIQEQLLQDLRVNIYTVLLCFNKNR